MKKFKKILYMGTQIVLILLIILNIVVICSQRNNENDLLEGVPFGVIEVTGNSMEPYLSPGDGIFVYEIPFEDLKPQDTILFFQDGQLITHRIQTVGDGYVITRGTANDIDDQPVTEESYRAKVLFSIPYLNVFLVFYDSPIYFIIFAIFLFFFIFGRSIAVELYERIEQMKSKMPKEEHGDDLTR